MNLAALIVYGLVNLTMVIYHLINKNRLYEFPFWAGMIALGWFFPQAIGGYLNSSQFPPGAYANGMLFAALCTVALWYAFNRALAGRASKPSWLDASFDTAKLYQAGAVLCMCGFFFQWKLAHLPEELTSMTQWTGPAVKYLFLSSIFVFGFLTLWLIYLNQSRLVVPRLWIFIIPSLLLLLQAAVLHGRRAAMMDLVSYLLVGLWFVRRVSLPRWFVIAGLTMGLALINAIGAYRAIMSEKGSLSERLAAASKIDFANESENVLKKSGLEFSNYIFYRQVYAEVGNFDWGLVHWNGLVANYVPAQIVGRSFKNSLMILLEDRTMEIARSKYGHPYGVGTTVTGYTDAFASFGWFGFVKFMVIGWIMGVLYRHAMQGSFLGQLLYVYSLSTAMHSVSHVTHTILFSIWIYFFALGYPALHFAKIRPSAGDVNFA